MTTGPAAVPLSLRSHLRDLQAALDEAASAHLSHRRDHGCREGRCREGKQLAAAVSDADWQLGMTRFLAEEED